MSRLSGFLSGPAMRGAASSLLRSGSPAAMNKLRAAAVPALMSLAGPRAVPSPAPSFSTTQSIPMSFAASGLGAASSGTAGSLNSGTAGEVAESNGEGGSSAVSTGSTSDSDTNALSPRRKKRKL